MIHLSLKDVLAMPDRKRATLMNYLSGFKSANLVGTTDAQHRHNLAIFNSVVHIGANPPYLALSFAQIPLSGILMTILKKLVTTLSMPFTKIFMLKRIKLQLNILKKLLNLKPLDLLLSLKVISLRLMFKKARLSWGYNFKKK